MKPILGASYINMINMINVNNRTYSVYTFMQENSHFTQQGVCLSIISAMFEVKPYMLLAG